MIKNKNKKKTIILLLLLSSSSSSLLYRFLSRLTVEVSSCGALYVLLSDEYLLARTRAPIGCGLQNVMPFSQRVPTHTKNIIMIYYNIIIYLYIIIW